MFDGLLGALSTAGSTLGNTFSSGLDSLSGLFSGGSGMGALGSAPGSLDLGSLLSTTEDSGFLDSLTSALGSEGFANLASGAGNIGEIGLGLLNRNDAKSMADKQFALQSDAFTSDLARQQERDEALKALTF